MNRTTRKTSVMRWALLALTLAPIARVAAETSSPAKLTLEDLIDASGLSTISLSPDGKQFAISNNGQIALVPSTGGWPSTLTTGGGGKQGSKWSPDGTVIAFSSEGAIWKIHATGGQPVRLTDGRRGAGDPRTAADRAPQWSPDGKWILFETGRRGHSDLGIVSHDGLTTTLLTSTSGDAENAAWSPDGTQIAYVERSREHFSGRLFVANFDTVTGRFKGEPAAVYTAKEDRGGGWAIRHPEWSPDGKSIAVVLQESGWDKIYLVPAAGGAPKALTTGESEDASPVFSPDGKQLAFVSNRDKPEERHVWVVAVHGGQPQPLAVVSAGVEGDPKWSPDGQQIYFLHTSSFEPASLAVAQADGSTSRILIRTQPVNFAHTGLTQPEVVRYKSKDGLEVAAILYKPLNYAADKRYPAVLWIHGGPEAQDNLGWDPWALYLAQHGYVVLQPNYRGSSGYGEKFRNLNVEDSGGGEVDDVALGAAYLVSHGLADKERIGIGGGSHGGTMVAYEVTKQPNVFHAAIELYGVVDRASFIERTNRSSAVRWTTKMGGTLQQKPEVYRKANILADVPRITAPLLIMHGEDDPQVPPYESQEFTAALKKANKPYLYFTYPKELHGFAQKDHRLDAWRKQLAFLNYYLQPQSGRSITSTQEIVLDEEGIR
ncbi:MAG TPA: S9 family peptidase [Acidobacteriaceae bacterium]